MSTIFLLTKLIGHVDPLRRGLVGRAGNKPLRVPESYLLDEEAEQVGIFSFVAPVKLESVRP
jgi:hypothetical protein